MNDSPNYRFWGKKIRLFIKKDGQGITSIEYALIGLAIAVAFTLLLGRVGDNGYGFLGQLYTVFHDGIVARLEFVMEM